MGSFEKKVREKKAPVLKACQLEAFFYFFRSLKMSTRESIKVAVKSATWIVTFIDPATQAKHVAKFDPNFVCINCSIQKNQGRRFFALEKQIFRFFDVDLEIPEISESLKIERQECTNCSIDDIALEVIDTTDRAFTLKPSSVEVIRMTFKERGEQEFRSPLYRSAALVLKIAKLATQSTENVKLVGKGPDIIYTFMSASSGWLSPRRRRWPSYVSSTSESSSDDGAWGESSRPFSFSGRRTVYNPETGRRVRENSATGVRVLSSREDCPLGTVREIYRPRRGEPPSVITDRPCVPYSRGMTGKCPSGLTKSSKTGTCVLLETERKNRL